MLARPFNGAFLAFGGVPSLSYSLSEVALFLYTILLPLWRTSYGKVILLMESRFSIPEEFHYRSSGDALWVLCRGETGRVHDGA